MLNFLFVLALAAAVAKLWHDVGALRRRLAQLEGEGRIAVRRSEFFADFPPAWSSDAAARPPASETAAPTRAADASSTTEITPRPAARAVRAPAAPTIIAPPVVADTVGHPRDGGDPSRAVAPKAAPAMEPRVREDDASGAQPQTAAAAEASPPRPALSFEDIFGRKLPIWAGGVTLAVCGFLIVKYSIDAGLLSPLVRVLGGLLFGSGLIAGAEAALQNESRVRDPRVRQALAGAGVATLYASILVATNVYQLVSPLVAFGGLALVTLLAGFLSVRFGPPSAILGLVGGLAAPALVGAGEPNVPLLSAYLALAVGGLATLGRTQRWYWLGAAALVGGFGWGLVLIFTGALSFADSLSIGLFLLLLGVALPMLLFGGERGHLVRLASTLAATAQLAALVAVGGFAMLHWGLFGLLGIAAVWLSRREKPLADLPAPALLTALLLMAAWPDPTRDHLALVLGGAAAIFGLPALWRLWRAEGRLSDAGAIAALSAAMLALPLFHLDASEPTAALLALIGAGTAAGAALSGWRSPRSDARFVMLVGTAAVLLGIAAAFGLPDRAVAPVWAIIAAGLVLLARAADDLKVERLAWAAALACVTLFLANFERNVALERAAGQPGLGLDAIEALRWLVPAASALVFAQFGRFTTGKPVAQVAAVLLGYVAVAQVVPPALLPLVPAAAAATFGWFRRSDAATATAGALAAAWALAPIGTWLAGTIGAVMGMPLFVNALPTLADTATRLLAPGIAAGVVLWRHPPASPQLRRGFVVGLALLGGAAAHVAYKQLFAIDTAVEFVSLGLAERLLWVGLLTTAAALLIKRVPAAARALGAAAVAHLGWFSLVLHNPLWSEQAVGPLPVANLLLPLYALAFLLLWAAPRVAALPPPVDRARGWAQMLLILLFAASELRQLVHGSLLAAGDVGSGEDIARSIVAIGIAVGFLLWGLRRQSRDWRIASLGIMLLAVLKVFLFDVSGLDGLLRIASFAALGFSLIGIGWLYSRFLPDGSVNLASTSRA